MAISDIIIGIIIPLVSAIIGGGVTFLGVILTIRHSNKTYKQEYIERYKPVIRCHHPYDDFDSENAKNIYFQPQKGLSYLRINGSFINTDKANFSISGIFVNKVYYELDINTYIKKSEDFTFDIQIPEVNKITAIQLEILDDCNRKYLYELGFATTKSKDIIIIGITESSKNIK